MGKLPMNYMSVIYSNKRIGKVRRFILKIIRIEFLNLNNRIRN